MNLPSRNLHVPIARPRCVRRAVCVAALSALSIVTACCSTRPKPTLDVRPPDAALTRGTSITPPAGAAPQLFPSPQAVLAQHNARVADLSRLRTPVTLLIDAADPDQPAQRVREQLEGNLQFIQPAQVALRVDKVGQTLFVMGCNAERYWWIDFAEPRTAFVGNLSSATPEKAQQFGLPVHPLDLLELAAIKPLALTAQSGWEQPRGLLRVRDAARWGVRDVLFASTPAPAIAGVSAPPSSPPALSTIEPVAVWLLDSQGRLAAWSELSRHNTVAISGNTRSPARLARLVKVHVPSKDTHVEVIIIEPENPGARMKTAQFDLAEVLKAYDVRTIIDIDKPTPKSGARVSIPVEGAGS